MRTLQLTLKRQWFEMIYLGIKTEEYREIKAFWEGRLSKEYERVEFRNGYGHHVPAMTLNMKGVRKGQGKPEHGAPVEDVFIISLGELLDENNIPDELKQKRLGLKQHQKQ